MELMQWTHAIKTEIQEVIDFSAHLDDQNLLKEIELHVFKHSIEQKWTAKEKYFLVQHIFHAIRGLDILHPLMQDPEITEIMINAYDEIFVEKKGKICKTEASFENLERLEDLIQSIVSQVNRVVNESSPIVDARLKNGSRVNIVLPPVALKGPTMTIRKFSEKPMTMEDLLQEGAITQEAIDFLARAVQAKYNIFISGGTGSGKTTFLNALSNYIPKNERIITIEDTAELQLTSVPNWVRLETRNANTEGKGEIGVRELIRCALRMRPTRIIVGEVRGSEALDMLAALNTGHEGSLATVHSNSPKELTSRLEMMVLSGADLPIIVVRKQIAAAMDIVVQLSRLRDGTRRVVEISEFDCYEENEIKLSSLFLFEELAEVEGEIVGDLKRTANTFQHIKKLHQAGLIEKC